MARGWKRAPLLLGGIALLFAALAATAAGGNGLTMVPAGARTLIARK